METQVIWSPRAIWGLHEVFQFIAAGSPQAADKTVRHIKAAGDGLANFPEMGRPRRVRGTKELVISGMPYIIAYRIQAQTIEILHVLHASRKWPDVFKDKP